MAVSALPRGPDISVARPSYEVGESVTAECSTRASLPAPRIQWLISGHEAGAVRGVTVTTEHRAEGDTGLVDTSSMISLFVTDRYCQVNTSTLMHRQTSPSICIAILSCKIHLRNVYIYFSRRRESS